jgi:DNA-binding LacI/PurR family transcriptional regulator
MKLSRVDMAFDTAEAASIAERWVKGARPRAVFTYNDEYGMLLLSALQDAGLKVPGDIALVGCDDLPLCAMLRPRLTSVSHGAGSPAHEIAAHFDRMIRENILSGARLIPLKCQVIQRESS